MAFFNTKEAHHEVHQEAQKNMENNGATVTLTIPIQIRQQWNILFGACFFGCVTNIGNEYIMIQWFGRD
jgi:putative effector of murein hydrolase